MQIRKSFTHIKAILFIVIAGAITYINGISNAFVGDDFPQLVDNILVHTIQNIPHFFAGGTVVNTQFYRPLNSVYVSALYSLFGPNPQIFHIVQILLCIVNACLLYILFNHFFKEKIALFLSLLFLVHPINSELAFYISDIQDVLFFLFGTIGLLLFILSRSQKIHILGNVSLLLSLLSKETGVVFLFVSFVYLSISNVHKRFQQVIYLVIVFGIYLALRVHAVGFFAHTVPNAPIAQLPFTLRMLNTPAMMFFYLKTFFYPTELASLHQWVYIKPDILHIYLPAIVDSAFIAANIFAAILFYKKHNYTLLFLLLFFTAWFYGGLFFHMQLIPLDATVADRWFYMPAAGLLGQIGVLLLFFQKKVLNSLFIFIASALIITCAIRTFIRSFDWIDDITQASHDLRVSPQAYNLEYQLSYAYFKQGDFEEAKNHAQRSVQLFPYSTNYSILGAAYTSLDDYENAQKSYQHSTMYGDYYITYENLAVLSTYYGNPSENIQFLKTIAVKKYPTDGVILLNLAVLEYMYGNKSDAKLYINRAIYYNTSNLTRFVYDVIAHDKPLQLKVNHGQILYQSM